MRRRKKGTLASKSWLSQTKVSSVIVSSKAEVPKGLRSVPHVCGKCESSFATNSDLSPFCLHCGSDDTSVIANNGSLKIESMLNESSLSSVYCPNCKNRNIMTDTTAKALEGYMSCVACSNNIVFKHPEESEEFDTEDESLEEPLMTVDEESDIGGDGVSDEVNEGEEVLMTLSELAFASMPDKKVAFVRAGSSSICAFVGDICIARLRQDDVGDNADLFHEASYLKSIRTSVASSGLNQTLADYGFKNTQVTLSGSHLRKFKIEEAVTGERERIRAEMSNTQAVFQQCMQLASAGLNKGFFKQHTHILKAKLFESLVDAGLKAPNVVIDKVFSSHSDEYSTTLLAVANELMTKSEDVRNELSDTIQGANYQMADDLEEDDLEMVEEFTEDDIDAPLESRLEASFRPSKGTSVTSSSKSGSVQDIYKRFAGKGKLF